MGDWSELKRLAKAADPTVDEWYGVGELRYEDRRSSDLHGLHHDDERFIAAAKPAAVLALIAENERMKQSLLEFNLERDQLKAENEALRKDLESHKRMLLAAALDMGRIGEALGAEMDDDASELESIAVEMRKDAERFRYIEQDADSGMRRIYGDDWLAVVDAGGFQEVPDSGPRPNRGHGHVFLRADGVRARCGGPGMCKECSLDQERKDKNG